MHIKSDIEAFEFITRNLIKQNEKSMNHMEECAYRGYSQKLQEEVLAKHELSQEDLDEDDKWGYFCDIFMDYDIQPDLKCAVGFIIPDELYDGDIESTAADTPSVLQIITEAHKDWEITDMSVKMMLELQQIHDRKNLDNWVFHFSKFNFNEDGSFLSADLEESKDNK